MERQKTFRDVLTGVAVLLAVVGVLGAVAHNVRTDDAPARAARALATGGDASPDKFESAEHTFRAAFPVAPKREVHPISVPGASLTLTWYEVLTDGLVYAAGSSPFGAGLPFDFQAGARGAASRLGGNLQSSTETTFQGFPAVDLVITKDGGVIRQFIVRAPDRIVQLVVAGARTGSEYERFRASLEIL